MFCPWIRAASNGPQNNLAAVLEHKLGINLHLVPLLHNILFNLYCTTNPHQRALQPLPFPASTLSFANKYTARNSKQQITTNFQSLIEAGVWPI